MFAQEEQDKIFKTLPLCHAHLKATPATKTREKSWERGLEVREWEQDVMLHTAVKSTEEFHAKLSTK